MSFTALIFLFGSLAVVGPLLAHLLAKPRFKRISFTMLRFLETGHKESQSRRRFRDIFILLLRCLIIVLIAMMFAGPLLLSADPGDEIGHVYYIGLDDSASMAYRDADESYFEKMRSEAIDHIRSSDNNGTFNICALASGKWANNLTRDLALSHVKRLKLSCRSIEARRFVSDIHRNLQQHSDDTEVSILVISDFTPQTLQSFSEIDLSLDVGTIEYKTIAPVGPVNNAAIIEAHAGRFEDGKLSIDVSVVNYSSQKQKRILTARTDDAESAGLDIELGSYQQQNFSVQINIDKERNGEVFIPIELSLSQGDGLQLDDSYYLAISMPQQNEMNILIVGKSVEEMFLLKTAADTVSTMDHYETINVKIRLLNGFDVSLLKWADVLMYSSMPSESELPTKGLNNFVAMGGKLIFFMAPDLNKDTADKLYDAGLLPAKPQKYIKKQTYIESASARDGQSGSASFDSVIQSLENYKLQNIAVSGSYQCSQRPEALCHWRFRNGNGFIYSSHVGNGTCMLINTSADDSMSSLTRSSSSVAFCRYLLGSRKQIGEHVFASDEKVLLPASAMEIEFAKSQKPIWIQTCDGEKHEAVIVDSFLIPTKNGGTGWINTLTKPLRYAGVNLGEGETDVTSPGEGAVAKTMDRIFSVSPKKALAAVGMTGDKNYRSLWKIFAWAVIALIFAEAGLVNRMRR